MTNIQYIPQYCRKKNSVYQPHSNNIHQLYNSAFLLLNIQFYAILRPDVKEFITHSTHITEKPFDLLEQDIFF